MVDLLKGRSSSSRHLPPEITEFFIAKEFRWTLDYIRSMSPRDIRITTQLLNLYQRFQSGDLDSKKEK